MCPWYLSLIILTYAANGFQFKCPPSTQRQFRAKALCSNTATYYCLQDDLKGGFTENCSRVDYDQPGKRIILRGGFDNGPCSENLYQPRVIKYWTNVSTDCIYHKSLCSEEGQVEYDDGGVHFDKTCTCEYTRGYTFVNIPRNPCFCQPLTEDCSCYKKTDMNDSWWKDHDCSFPFDKISGHVLLNERQIKTTKQPDNSRVERTSFIYEMHSSFIWHFGKQKSLLMGLIIVMCLILVLLTTLLSYATLDKTNGCYNLKNKYLFKAFVTRPFASSLECFEGNSFTLECEISVGTVRCFKGLTDITDKWTIIKRKYGYHYELNISVMRREDSDTYSIRDESGSTLLETLLCCKKILIDYPPRQLECLEGDICTFTWKVISEDVKLYKDGDILSMNNCLSRTENTYTFTLSAMTDQDGGKYTLQNTNGYTFSTTLLTFKKNVTVFPNERVECVEGDQCCLQWKVISRDVQLYKNDQIITKFFLYTNDVYTFTVNSMSTEDEGKYTLRNQNGYIFTITNLFLKPFFKRTLGNKALMEGLSLSLTCEVEDNTFPAEWFKNGRKIDKNQDHIQITQLNNQHSLTIEELEMKDSGIYKIEVNNRSSEAYLDVQEMPKEIKEMAKKDRDAFLKAVKEEGTSSRRFIRIMIVGKSGAGKTSLLKRLLGEDIDISKIQSTDGINIEIRKCKINLQTNEWINLLDENIRNNEAIERNNLIANCGFWDFAGQQEYYATHQAFLTANAIFLLVVDLSDDFKHKTVENKIESDFSTAGEYIDFWFDNIHCYAVEEHVDDDEKLLPPVLVIGTCIDKIEEDELQSKRNDIQNYLHIFLGRQKKRNHWHDQTIKLVSNAFPEMYGSFLDEIKQDIIDFAKRTKHTTLPVKWILMEKILAQRLVSGNIVISYQEFKTLAENNHMSLDVDLFLRYEHEIGNIIFFQDVKNFIILDHKWLVDAFRCLVASEEFCNKQEDGKYPKDVIIRRLNKCPDRRFSENVDFLNAVMEKFDILVKPKTETGKLEYYMPCMMSGHPTKDIWKKFGGDDESFFQTSWLCMDFEFLPPALYNHVLALYLQKYNICVDNNIPALFKNMGMFRLDSGGLYKLIVCASLNSIALQVLENKDNQWCYNQLIKELLSMVEKVFKRYKIKLRYCLTLLCSKGSHYSKNGKYDIATINKIINVDDKYYCQEHRTNHTASAVYDSWFGKSRQTPSFRNNLTENNDM